ncbi:MAG: hypothetical protein DI539_23420 [Flavobacterium psychrophilum]|nr:MAG: hypothetical protein DI539_23420 [Flavobacterium psychrophilum]
MKKLPISLVAILAIVFAVSSAFKTKSVKFAPAYEMWKYNATQQTASGIAVNDHSDFLSIQSSLTQTPVASTSGETIPQFLSNNDLECDPEGDEYICVAKVLRDVASPSSADVIVAFEIGALTEL